MLLRRHKKQKVTKQEDVTPTKKVETKKEKESTTKKVTKKAGE